MCKKTARKVGAEDGDGPGIASHAGLNPEAVRAISELARQTEWLHSLNNQGRGTSPALVLLAAARRSSRSTGMELMAFHLLKEARPG